ncbi:hypothetical protein PRIPAC_80814 [Pristionchus pacificus]|uniref:Uncharacterized protein n=1 Tax=Pristionchus pacificus TaxID=54126 RepID=A0A2A6BE93_PRIPA|nr:hypothetical protein PRIPAC_80814 [Pristionchus pacificus]|eukprot:PDM64188.1 hypothetical protein PRIPAC_54432 [Pristionchus pacificus]
MSNLTSYSIPRPFPYSNEPISSSVSNGSLTGEVPLPLSFPLFILSLLQNVSSALSSESITSSSSLSVLSDVSSVVSLDTKYQRDMKDVIAQYKDDPALVRDLLCAYETLRSQSSKKSRGSSFGGISKGQLNLIAFVAAACALTTYAVALMNRETFCKM